MKDETKIKLFLVDDDALFRSLGSCLHEPGWEENSVRETRTKAAVLQLESICTTACTELEEEYTILKNTKA